jgi:deoxyribodipyrimidine photo-lyase
VNTQGDYVIYWITAYRRTTWNYSLDRAVEWAKELDKPLVILEALRCGYQWASDRLHEFILNGMSDHAEELKGRDAFYYPFVESASDEGKGLLRALSAQSCVIITDDFPAFFLPRMVLAAARIVPVLLEQVDANGLLPVRAVDRVFPTAYAFRRFLQKNLPIHIAEPPQRDPLKDSGLKRLDSLPEHVLKRWPLASSKILRGDRAFLKSLPISHEVGRVAQRGGPIQARQMMKRFLEARLSGYPQDRNHPDEDGTSGLSPHLHFGFLSVHQVFDELAKKEEWSLDRLAPKATGSRTGWWGMSEPAEAFLDELITWRELGFNMCWQREDYDAYESLPGWALKTLGEHRDDVRAYCYRLEECEAARTHDLLWNAAQRQLLQEGRIHNYLRMLWGKKILEWSVTPQEALRVMIELNNKYALDGRDPNSYSGIFWVLGRYDRPWGPERPVFGKVRYMSSKNTARKVRVKNYLETYGP